MSESDVADDSAASAARAEPGESVPPQSGPRSESYGAVPRRRSSIRPVSPDWQPPVRSDSPPRPMVVVYSGDNQGPPIDWEKDESLGPTTTRATPAEPFYLPRDLPLPSIPDFEALAPPISASVAESVQPGREAAAAFDGQPVAAYAPGEIDALVAYELAAAEFRAELETPSVRREVLLAPVEAPAPSPAEVPAEEARAPEPSRRVWPLIVGGLVMGSALAGVLAWSSQRSSTLSGVHANSTGVALASALANEAQAAPATTHEIAAGAAPSVPAPEPRASAAAPALDPDRRSTKVVLQVLPLDAKVTLRGMKRRGPPFEFEIPRGRRVTIEVSRKGFMARKVVLDGREAALTIGLSPDKRYRRDASDAAGGVATEPSIGVRSGL